MSWVSVCKFKIDENMCFVNTNGSEISLTVVHDKDLGQCKSIEFYDAKGNRRVCLIQKTHNDDKNDEITSCVLLWFSVKDEWTVSEMKQTARSIIQKLN